MKKYFYSDGSNSLGPFTIEELKERNLNRTTSVWFQEIGEWKPAGQVEELRELFALVPPPVPYQLINPPATALANNNRSTIDVLVLISMIYWFSMNLIDFLLTEFVDNWYDGPIKYIRFVLNCFWFLMPLILPLAITNKTLRTIGLIVGSILCMYLIYNNLVWIIADLKKS